MVLNFNVVIVKLDNSNWKLDYDKDGKFVKKTEMKMRAPKAAPQAK